VQYSVCHECQFVVDPFQKIQPVKYREGIGHMVVVTKLKYQMSCVVKYGLEASLKIGRNSDSSVWLCLSVPVQLIAWKDSSLK